MALRRGDGHRLCGETSAVADGAQALSALIMSANIEKETNALAMLS